MSDLIQRFLARRTDLLAEALAEAKKWCVAPGIPVERSKRSDQYWLTTFPSPAVTVSDEDVRRFLSIYGLSRWVKWNERGVANCIEALRGEAESDPAATVSALTYALLGQIIGATRTRQTSAASKIAFFTLPGRELFIWDQFAIRSARFHEWLSTNSERSPRSFHRAYMLRGASDYGGFAVACRQKLAAERQRPDFGECVAAFGHYLRGVGGPMADGLDTGSGTFHERRLLDKLMFFEGRYLESTEKPA